MLTAVSAALAASACLLTCLCSVTEYSPSSILPTAGFVAANGTGFSLEGRPFRFVGTNAWYLSQIEIMTDDKVVTFFARASHFGLKVVRYFAFSNGCDSQTSTKIATQPAIGQYNEQGLRRVDLVMREAGRNGIRILLNLSNFEPFLGGWQWWVDQVLGIGHPLEAFMTDERVKSAYKSYVSMLLGRTNVFTQMIYRDDPTIFAVELANEPHTRPLFEKLRGIQPGGLALGWLNEMAAFGIDQKHMISTGEEGYRADGPTECCRGNQWLNGGYKGVDFVRNVALPNVSFATVHVYPDNWRFRPDNYKWIIANFVRDRADIAHRVNKPIVMEEFGMRAEWLPSRDDFIKTMGQAAIDAGYAGMMIWQIRFVDVPLPGPRDYSFMVGESGTDALAGLVAWSWREAR